MSNIESSRFNAKLAVGCFIFCVKINRNNNFEKGAFSYFDGNPILVCVPKSIKAVIIIIVIIAFTSLALEGVHKRLCLYRCLPISKGT